MSPKGLISANRKQRLVNGVRALRRIPVKPEPATLEKLYVLKLSAARSDLLYLSRRRCLHLPAQSSIYDGTALSMKPFAQASLCFRRVKRAGTVELQTRRQNTEFDNVGNSCLIL